ncbi:MAG: hypothetical protein IT337_02310 [Thermomicrobiales bacterium]|nr:hypothetical protein [Thermomicrobiales bacterium]
MTAPPPPARPGTAQLPRSAGPRTGWLLVALLVLLALGAVVLARRAAEPPLPPTSIDQTGPLPPSAVLGIFVQPIDGRSPILDEIDAARSAVDLEVYLLSDEETIRALERAAARGVAVRVMLEEHPYGGGGGQQATLERLLAAGIDARWSDPAFRFSHIKTFVIDGSVALVMNQNLTYSSFAGNREFGATTTRPNDVAAAQAIFESDWNRGPEPPPGPLVVSPTNSRADLLEMIDDAAVSLDVYAEVLRDQEFVDALAAAARRGVAVRIVMSPGDERQQQTLRDLATAGVRTRLVTDIYVHAKIFVADGARAFVGSQNMTATSLDLNRELGVIFDDPGGIERIERVFDEDFRHGREVESS